MHFKKKGFTLIELIVVMAILAILVMLGVLAFTGYTKDANVTAMLNDCKIIENAGYQYAIANGDTFPLGSEVTGYPINEALAGQKVFEIDKNAISNYLRSTKFDISDYCMDAEGRVWHKKGLVNSKGQTVFGIGSLPKPDADDDFIVGEETD
jgi:prepilin-type N-terminal cleavage/methylation domain-containing protein